MKKTKNLLLLGLLAITAILNSCSKDSDKNPGGETTIKYEVTGNYTGQMTVVFTNETGSNGSELVTSLPWSKEVKVKNATPGNGVGFGGGWMPGQPLGAAGQSVTAKIYANGTEKTKANTTTNNSGGISIPSLAYTF